MNWEFLTGDVNWEIYGGTFVSEVQDEGATRILDCDRGDAD